MELDPFHLAPFRHFLHLLGREPGPERRTRGKRLDPRHRRVHLAQLAVLAHQPRERRRVGDDLRAGDLHRQLLIARLDALQLARDALLFVIAALH